MDQALSASRSWTYSLPAHGVVIALWLGYAILTFMAPASHDARIEGLPGWEIVAIRLSIILPILIIWLVALRGAITFKYYARLIGQSPEGAGLNNIANGLLCTLIYLIASSLTGSLMPFFVGSHWLESAVAIRNHLPVIITFIAFLLLYTGSHQLRNIAGVATWNRATTLILILFAVVSAGFTLAFVTSPVIYDSRGVPSTVTPKSILLFTLILPYLASWFMGILATLNIARYARGVKGIIYRQALRDLIRGILAIIFFGMLLQFLTVLSRFLSNLGLGQLLLLVYVILGSYALGFWFVREGAKKLTRIEVAQ
jgi:hypothetical protein